MSVDSPVILLTDGKTEKLGSLESRPRSSGRSGGGGGGTRIPLPDFEQKPGLKRA